MLLLVLEMQNKSFRSTRVLVKFFKIYSLLTSILKKSKKV